MPTKPPQKTREQQMAERRAEFDAMHQMEAQWQAERAEWQREHDELAQRVQAHHDAIAEHIHRSWAQRSDEPMSAAEFYRAQGEIQEAAFEQAKVEGSIPTLDQVFATATQESALSDRQQQREIEADPLHQRYLQSLEDLMPPAVMEARKREHFASQREITVDESYSALQAAKQDVAKEEKQLKALQSGRVLSPGELPYQERRLEQAKQQEQMALQQFNELAGVPQT